MREEFIRRIKENCSIINYYRLFCPKYHLSLNQILLAIADVHTHFMEISANKADVW